LIQQGKVRCRYDYRGRLVELVQHDRHWHYDFNAQGRLVRAESARGTVVTFAYDALGRRIWKRCGQRAVRYLWLGEKLLSEMTYEHDNLITQQDYLYITPRDFNLQALLSPQATQTPKRHFSIHAYVPLATRINGQVYYYHTDHLGTPRRLTDAQGQVVWAADYSAFGQAFIKVQKVVNHLRLPGQYYDSETGLHYNRFRYYVPLLGRYISRDPIGYVGGLNLYAYGQNNPVNVTDTLGLLWGAIQSALGALKDLAVSGWNLLKDICWQCILAALLDIHVILDLVGLIPVIGEVADGVNALIYLAEGDFTNAALSAAAMIPVAGVVATAGKWLSKGGKYRSLALKAAQKGAELAKKAWAVGKKYGKKVVAAGKKAVTAGVQGAKKLGKKASEQAKESAEKIREFSRKFFNKPDKVVTATDKTDKAVEITTNINDKKSKVANLVDKINETAKIPYDRLLKTRKDIINSLSETVQSHLKSIKQFDSEAQVGIRGSLVRGTKGPHKGNVPFNPDDFDVDAFIVSDKLAEQFPRGVPFRSGNTIDEIANIQQSIDKALRQNKLFSGLRKTTTTRSGKVVSDSFTFRIFTQKEIQKLQAKQDSQLFFIDKVKK